MKLSIESLESRQALAAYTTQVLDPNNLVPADVEAKMLANLDYAMRNASNFISWKGVLDARITVRPMMAGFEGGVVSSIDSDMPGNRSGTVYEMLTGIDPNGPAPDLGADVWVARDGTVKVYGMNAWYDPSPAAYLPANVPAGSFDFVGVLSHELFHGFGFRQTVEFTKYVTKVNGNPYFNGPNTVALLGRPLPMGPVGTHYGNTSLPDNPIGSGLMFQWGNYAGNRLDIGKLDLAILRDVGITVKNTDGLPLVDTMDGRAPRNTLSNPSVAENVPLGTSVGIVSTTAGSRGFSFSLPEGLGDNGAFRIVGNTLTTAVPLDYETKASYAIQIRNSDASGVWTDTVITVGVRDMDDTPRIVAPNTVPAGRQINLGFIGVSGDYNAFVAVSVFAKTGNFKSDIKDPTVWVSFALPWSGGMIVSVIGSPQSISRNMKFITYTGNEAALDISISARLGGVWISDRKSVILDRRIFTGPLPVIVPGNNPTLTT